MLKYQVKEFDLKTLTRDNPKIFQKHNQPLADWQMADAICHQKTGHIIPWAYFIAQSVAS